MQIIPLQAVPSQTVTALLADQDVQVDVYQKNTGLYCNVWLAGVQILAGALCLDKVRIVRNAYFGFAGDLGFVDQQGMADPDYTGLGSRFLLCYLEASDIGAALDV